MFRGACQTTVSGVTKSWTWLSKHTFVYTHTSFRPGQDGSAHLIGLVPLEKKREWRAFSSSLQVRTRKKLHDYSARWWPPTSQEKRPQSKTRFAGNLIMDLPGSGTVRYQFCFLSHSVYDICYGNLRRLILTQITCLSILIYKWNLVILVKIK